MTTDDRKQLLSMLVSDEGIVLHAYKDSLGYLTIGCGRLVDKRLGGGITHVEALYLLSNDVDRTVRDLLTRYPWTERLDPVRQIALVNLCFNLGIEKLSKFVNTMGALERGDWELAATGLKSSLWYRQVQPSRSDRIVHMIRTGSWPAQGMKA